MEEDKTTNLIETLDKMKKADEETEEMKGREIEEAAERKRILKEERDAKRIFDFAERKRKDKEMNERTKPWLNDYKEYSDEEFRMILDGNSDDENDFIKIGLKLKRRATAIRELRRLRNRYLETGKIPQNLWGQSESNGPHDLPEKPDHTGRQLKRLVDELPDYYRGFI